MDQDFIHSANLVDVVYGDRSEVKFDESEDWFELTKIVRESMSWEMLGIQKLMNSPELNAMSRRSGRRYESCTSKPLEIPEQPTNVTLVDVLQRRRSASAFTQGAVGFEELSIVCSLGYGITARSDDLGFRTAPSAGALYPIDVFVHVLNVDGLRRGVYHYSAHDATFELVSEDVDEARLQKALMQEENGLPAFVVTLVATFWRTRFKYAHRGMRFALIEAGHIAQNFLLAATACGLGSRAIGGFIDDELNSTIPGINGTDDAAVYSLLIGQQS